METLHSSESINGLVKKLCLKISVKQNEQQSTDILKRLRSNAYEILLHKRRIENVGDSQLQNKNSLCRLLAWQFTLAYEYEQIEHSEKLGECIKRIENSPLHRNKVLLDMIDVLLALKSVPKHKRIQGSKLYSTSKKPLYNQADHEFSFRIFDERSFHIPPDLYSASLTSKTSLESMVLKKKSMFIAFVENDCTSRNISVKNTSSINTRNSKNNSLNNSTINSKEKKNIPTRERDLNWNISSHTNNNYISQIDVLNNENPTQDFRNIWEIVADSKFDKRRTWETLQNPAPEKERPFLLEANSNVGNLMRHMNSSIFADVIAGRQEVNVVEENKLNPDDFVADLKLLLVGTSSRSFILKADNNSMVFDLNDGFYVDDLSAQAIKSFIGDFLHSASCYLGLNNMCEATISFRAFQQRGYIFKEICNRIATFLSFYRISISSHANSTDILKFYSCTESQRSQIDLLAQACSVGPYKDQIRHHMESNMDQNHKAESTTDNLSDGSMFSGDCRATKDELGAGVRSGIAMLDNLYTNVLHLNEGPVLMAAYAILLPCLELYYSNFLQQWLFHGHFDDPYNEFFIRSNPRYVITKGRIYWTRSYMLQHDLIPIFLTELADDILYCGKCMNLLNITNQKRSNSLYWNEKIPNIRICLNFKQLNILQHNMNEYHVDILAANGKFSVANILRKNSDENVVFLNLVAQKQACTLKRIECQRIIDLERTSQEKLKQMQIIRANYESVKRDKEIFKAEELEKEIALNEGIFKIQELRDKIIKDEAMDMIDHYNKLFAISDKRKAIIDRTIQQLLSIQLKLDPIPTSCENLEQIDIKPLADNTFKSSEDDFEILDVHPLSGPEILDNKIYPLKYDLESVESPKNITKNVHTSKSLDFLNANTENNQPSLPEINDNQIIENLTAAQKNKLKVMSSEYNIISQTEFKQDAPKVQNVQLTALQRNRFKIMSSHFLTEENEVIKTNQSRAELTALQKNRLKVLSTEFGITIQTKEDVLNKNVPANNDNEIARNSSKDIFYDCSSNTIVNENNSRNKLILDFSKLDSCKSGPSLFAKFLQSPNFEFSKPIPMSVDTTPMSEVSTIFKSSEYLDIAPSTAATRVSNEEFEFPVQNTMTSHSIRLNLQPIMLTEVQNVSNNFLKILLRDSVVIPLKAQLSLTSNTLLKYIFVDLQYFKHTQSLRDYFFLLDGEFGRNITDILFEALYKCSSPQEVINIRFLNSLITEALEFSSKEQTMSSALSFKINFMPKVFSLQKVDTLSCISMIYKMPWPLNILFPSDVIGKYDEIFRFLLKLRRVSWVLQKIFMEFKILSKRVGKRCDFLTLSPQYQRLHQFRHVMMHFIQTYENYIVGEVLQSSWFEFKENLQKITTFDNLFDVHFKYIKNIEFMCLLNQRAFKLREAIYGIYTVILKFYEYLRARPWEFQDTVFIHPNFEKLEQIYNNFENFVKFVFKTSKKVASQGAQPQLLQFVDMLNVNDYYSKKIVNVSVDSSMCASYH